MTAPVQLLGRLTGRVTTRIDRLSDRRFAVLTFLPGALLVFLFVIPPIVIAFGLSAFRIELLKTNAVTFNFPNNLVRLLQDNEFLAAVPRTLLFGIGTIVVTLPISLVTALMLNRRFRGSALLGLAVLLPYAVAGSVTGLFWKFIFQSNFGLMTTVTTAVGLTDHPIDWLFNTTFAVIVAVLATAWRFVPLYALLLLAALKTIPQSLYRAAAMDGATAWQSFRWVTLPGISRMLVVVTALIIINAFQIFDTLFTLTHGGPGSDTTTVMYYIYRSVQDNLSFGYGSTMSVVLLLVTLLFTSVVWLLQFRGRQAERVVDDTADLSTTLPTLPSLRPTGTAMTRRWTSEETESVPRRRFRPPPVLNHIAVGIVAAIVLLWLVGPVLWIFISSVTPEGYITHVPPLIGQGISLDSFATLLRNPAWAGSVAVSLQLAIYTTVICLVLGALAAYPLARLDVPGKGVITAIIVVTQTVPSIVLAIPTLFIFRAIGLADTLVGLVVINVAYLLPLVLWLLRNVFEGVPRALESAARIDGCSRLGALFRITVPAASPGIAAVVILSLIAVWNEFTFAVILGNKNTVTVTRQIGFIDSVSGPFGSPPFTVLAAAGIIAIAPCLVLVLLFNRRVVAGITEGFVKG